MQMLNKTKYWNVSKYFGSMKNRLQLKKCLKKVTTLKRNKSKTEISWTMNYKKQIILQSMYSFWYTFFDISKKYLV